MRDSGLFLKGLFVTTGMLTLLSATSALAEEPVAEVADVVVTAQKRAENIQDVPSSVSVLDNKSIASLNATQLTDFSAYIPGLQVSSGGTPGKSTIAIRGIAPIANGATVGTYVDDTPVGSSSVYANAKFFSLDLLPYDISRVEVLIGPQGTLYGASALGGLVKYVLTSPSVTSSRESVGGDLSAISKAGSLGYGVRAMVNAPIVQDKLGFYGSVGYSRTPGYIDEVNRGVEDANHFYQLGARTALLWQPTGNASLQLNALFQRVHAAGDASIALSTALTPVVGKYANNGYGPAPFDKDFFLGSATGKWDLGFAELTSTSSYSQIHIKQVTDYSRTFGVIFPRFGSPVGMAFLHNNFDIDKYTQEIRLASKPGDKLEWMVGGFATYEESVNPKFLTAQSFAGAPVPIANPLVNASLNAIYREYAAFGNATYHATDKLDVSAGLRFTRNSQTYEQFNGGLLLQGPTLKNNSHESVVNYSFSPAYHFSRDVMAYVRVASGYQPGGPNLVLANVPPSVNSSTLVNYEVGLKSQFLDRRVTLDLAAYHIKWKDIQISATNSGGFSYFINGGGATSDGFEATVQVKPVTGLVLLGTVSYDKAVLKTAVPAIGAKVGDSLPNIPRWSGSLRADYTWDLAEDWTGQFGAGLRLVGDRRSDVNSASDSFVIPSYAAVDLNLDFTHGPYQLGLFVKNATNEHGYTGFNAFKNGATGQVAQIEATIIQPRTLGVRLDAQF